MPEESPTMTLEARAFAERLPWRQVKAVPVGEGLSPEVAEARWGRFKHVVPDPHFYVIRDWSEVDTVDFDRFVRTIRAKGRKGRYTPPYRPDKPQTNRYLVIGGEDGEFDYWYIWPKQLCRQRVELRQYEPILEQESLLGDL